MINDCYDNATQKLNMENLVALVSELKTKLNALRVDFRSHDHGNTGSYVQNSITIRSSAQSFVGTAETSAAVSGTAPTNPLVDLKGL
jgi:hypothetical protein